MEKNRMIKIALIAGVLLLLLGNAFLMFRNSSVDWQHYQRAYLDKAAEKTDDRRVKEALVRRAPRIEQVVITGFGKKRVDRCTTCHAGISDGRFKNEKNPLRSHPPVPGGHSFDKFGCTICHDGNGRGLSVRDGHGEINDWMEPLVKGPYIEANCGKCHPYPYLKETPVLAQGRKLFKSEACYGCHRVDGVSKGSLGIELTLAGAKRTVTFLKEKIEKPKGNNPETIMPVMAIPPKDVMALVVFLKSLKGDYMNESSISNYLNVKKWKKPEQKTEVPVSIASGKDVFAGKSCKSCHSINAIGGKTGPDLSTVGLRRTREWIIQHFIDPRSLVADSIMPDFTYSRSEMEALASYLESLKKLSDDAEKIIEKKFAGEGSK